MPSAATRRAACALLLAGSAALAQTPVQTPLPDPTADAKSSRIVALIELDEEGGSGGGRSGRALALGRAPESVASTLLPPSPATVVGGVGRGRMATVVLTFPTSARAAIDSYAQFLERAGWKRPVWDEDHASLGFVHTSAPRSAKPAPTSQVQSAFLCRGTERILLAPAHAVTVWSFAQASLKDDPARRPCAVPSRSAQLHRELPWPVLRAPDGAVSAGGSSGSYGDPVASITTRLRTKLGASEVLAHYSAQLAADGWKVGAPLLDGELALQTLAARDARGRDHRGTITVVALHDGVSIEVRMVRVTGHP